MFSCDITDNGSRNHLLMASTAISAGDACRSGMAAGLVSLKFISGITYPCVHEDKPRKKPQERKECENTTNLQHKMV